jgi:polysaccharide export outer membrane protein
MAGIGRRKPLAGRRAQGGAHLLALLAALVTLGTGCHGPQALPPDVPRELAKVSLPPYVLEAPDILLIDALRLVPKPPYRIQPLDVLAIRASDTVPDQPINGPFTVEPEGTVNLGFNYGSVRVANMTLAEAREALEKYLQRRLKPGVQVQVAIAESRAMQLIRGPHLIRVDGTIGLGVYGSVYVDNMTIPQARAAIEQHLSQFVVDPEISLDVSGFNSKVYYVITDGGGQGEGVVRLPMTGKTTVLDAISFINGLPPVASKHHIWVARPAPADSCEELILPVDWVGITQRGQTATNYQLLPGDRLYVRSNALVKTDTFLARLFSPIERTLGVVLLGTTTAQAIKTLGAPVTAGGTTGGVR